MRRAKSTLVAAGALLLTGLAHAQDTDKPPEQPPATAAEPATAPAPTPSATQPKPPPAQPAPTAQQPAPPPQQQPPPPGYGYPPPPGYYPAPYPAPYPVYEPPPPWKPGQPAPPGYHVESRVDVKTIRSGAGMLVGFWIISVITGAVLNEQEEPASEDGDDVEPGDWSVLYWPVAGPFLAMNNVSTEDAGWALLLLDGIFQSVGVIGILIGLASTEEYLEPNRRSRIYPRLRVAPLAGPGFGGVGLGGNF